VGSNLLRQRRRLGAHVHKYLTVQRATSVIEKYHNARAFHHFCLAAVAVPDAVKDEDALGIGE
jgi:hypothetical protein